MASGTGSASAGPVSAYLAGLAPDVAALLAAIVGRAHELIPELQEGVSYSMPAILHRGIPLLAVIQRSQHLAYYPYSGRVVTATEGLLGDIPHSSGAVRFSLLRPLPPEVVDRLILSRRDEIDATVDR